MKYVGIDVTIGDMKRRWIVIFPEMLVHLYMAEAMKAAAKAQWPTATRIETGSAGFCDPVLLTVWGKSESLGGLAADPNDATYFNSAEYGANYIEP